MDKAAGAGIVYVLEKYLSISKKIENVTIPNVMAWSLNQQNFLFY